MTPEEKSAVAKAMQDAGAVIMRLDKSGYYQVDDVNEVLASAPSAFGFQISETPSACGGRKETPICATARDRTGRDWCDFMAKLPVRIRWREGESHDSRLLSFDLQSLLAVANNKAYVLATDTIDFGEPYLLVEIAADERTWTVYRFTGPGVGLGHCKPLVDGGESEDCWRRWSVVYDPEKSIARVEDYYDYAALSSYEPEETQ